MSITLLTIVACKNVEHGSQRERLRVAYVAKVKGSAFHDSLVKGVIEEGIRLEVSVDVVYPKTQQDVQGQKLFLNRIMESGKYRGVLLSPNDSSALISDVTRLDQLDIRFLLVDTPLLDSPRVQSFRNNCGFVGSDNILAGKLAARFITSELKVGNVLLVRGDHSHRSSVDRELGFLSEISSNHNFHILGPIEGFWNAKLAQEALVRFESSNKERIDAIFAYSDSMSLGLVSLFETARVKRASPIIVGVDGVLPGQRAVLQRKLSATIVQSPEMMGKLALRSLVECVLDRTIKIRSILTPVALLRPTTTLEAVDHL